MTADMPCAACDMRKETFQGVKNLPVGLVSLLMVSTFFQILLNPDFYETQLQKPHNKLKKAQIPLRENKLSLELKLGGGSTNPRSKGTPQPPLRRKSIRGAFSYLFSRAPLVFAGCPRVLSSRFLFHFLFFFFSLCFPHFYSSTYIYPPDVVA